MRKNLLSQFLKPSLKAAVPFLALMGMATFAEAQSGYNYKTVKSSNWNDISLWVRAPFSNPTAYTAITTTAEIPNRNSGNIEILDGHTVTYDFPNNVDQIIIKPGGVFELPAGKSLSLYVAASTDRLVVQGESGKQGIFRNLGGNISYTNGTSAVASNIEVGAYGKYEHAYAGSMGTIPTATWDANSDIEFKMTGALSGLTSAAYQSQGFSQTFGNVRWNTPTNTNLLDLKGAITNVLGNFEVVSTGTSNAGTSTSALVLSTSGTYNLSVGKSLIVSGGTSDLVFSTQGAPTGGTLNLTTGQGMQVSNGAGFRNNTVATPLKVLITGTGNLQSSYNLANMNFEVGPAANVTLASDLTVNTTTANFLVNGTLKTGTYAVKGTGAFTLADNATLSIGSPVGISASGLTGNIQVSGTRTYSGLANYSYNGSAAQVTGAGLPGTIAGLTISNAAGLTLTNPVVTSALKMTEGPIHTTAAKGLTVAANGTVQMPSPDKTSYINGPLGQMIASQATKTLTFPVGKNGTYRPVTLEITQNNSTATTYTAEQFEGNYPTNRTFPNTIDKVSLIRYFRITQFPVATLNEGLVTLTYGSDDGVNAPNALSIAKSSGTSNWMDLDGTAIVGANNSAGSVVGFFTDFSDFVLANRTGGTNPLPVELISFSAKASGNLVNLNWATASEKNNDRFEVERSINGVNFEAIAQVKGNGTTSKTSAYQASDLLPLAGMAYYRLKQIDLNGDFEYSEVIALNREASKGLLSIYPNPTTGLLSLKGNSSTIKNIGVRNLLGQEVYRQQVNATQMPTLNLSFLPAGTYQLFIDDQSETSVIQFIKADR